jgi:hypothetical protein
MYTTYTTNGSLSDIKLISTVESFHISLFKIVVQNGTSYVLN